MTERRLAIVGSRKFREPLALQLIEWMCEQAILALRPDVVISGGAEGVDKMAEQVAIQMSVRTHIMTPGQNRWEPNGYKARNLRIAETCTHLLCIRCSQAKTYGSGFTADAAERLGKKVYRRTI